jgi:hypothetical protein
MLFDVHAGRGGAPPESSGPRREVRLCYNCMHILMNGVCRQLPLFKLFRLRARLTLGGDPGCAGGEVECDGGF